MSFDPLELVRPGVRATRAFVAGRSLEELEAELGIDRAVELVANENALGPSPRAIEAAARAVTRANRYPDGSGLALRRRLAREHGLTPGNIALGAGSNELLSLLMHLFVGPGDEVVYSEPTFVMYGVLVRLQEGVAVAVPSRGLAHDLDAMLAAIGPRTRLVMVCNPNNPTGTMVDAAAWTRFLDRVPTNVVVVSDEAYHEYVDDPAYPRTIDDLARERPLVILRTFSKLYALAGLRIGYAIARPEVAALFDRVRVPYDVSGPALAAAEAALDDLAHGAQSRAVVRDGKVLLSAALPELGFVVHSSQTNFLLADLGRDVRPLCKALEQQGIRVRPMTSFGMAANFLRITIGTEDENRRLLAALHSVLGGTAAGVA